MTASYPGTIKNFTTKVDNIDYIYAAHVNDIQSEINAIEIGLVSGSYPSGGKFSGNVVISGNLLVSGSSTLVGDSFTMINGSGTLTTIGWASYTTRDIWYAKFGKIVFLAINIQGTSNSISGTMSLPYPISSKVRLDKVGRIQDNGTFTAARILGNKGSNELIFYSSITATTSFAASGTKAVFDELFYFTD